MAIKKITQTDFLLKTIDDTIRDLKLRRAEIMATRPKQLQPDLMTYLHCPSGRKLKIKGRKTA